MVTAPKDTLDKTLKILISIFVFTLITTVMIYRTKFSGDLSAKSNVWSDFGSFFGGVFGPLVSFLSLVAILKTIQIQKEILSTQRREFEKLIAAQNDTTAIQHNHLLAAEAQVKNEKIANFITTNIKMLEQQINLEQSIIKRCNESLAQLKELALNGADTSQLDEPSKLFISKIKESEKTIKILSKISIQISLGEFESIEDVKSKIMKALPAPV